MSVLVTNDKTVEFGIYFNSHYCHLLEKWAFAYQKHCGINTNMVLEILHKYLKRNIIIVIKWIKSYIFW